MSDNSLVRIILATSGIIITAGAVAYYLSKDDEKEENYDKNEGIEKEENGAKKDEQVERKNSNETKDESTQQNNNPTTKDKVTPITLIGTPSAQHREPKKTNGDFVSPRKRIDSNETTMDPNREASNCTSSGEKDGKTASYGGNSVPQGEPMYIGGEQIHEISELFEKLNISQHHVNAFLREDIRMEDLPRLSEDDIKELVPQIGPRIRLSQYITKLSSTRTSAPPTPTRVYSSSTEFFGKNFDDLSPPPYDSTTPMTKPTPKTSTEMAHNENTGRTKEEELDENNHIKSTAVPQDLVNHEPEGYEPDGIDEIEEAEAGPEHFERVRKHIPDILKQYPEIDNDINQSVCSFFPEIKENLENEANKIQICRTMAACLEKRNDKEFSDLKTEEKDIVAPKLKLQRQSSDGRKKAAAIELMKHISEALDIALKLHFGAQYTPEMRESIQKVAYYYLKMMYALPSVSEKYKPMFEWLKEHQLLQCFQAFAKTGRTLEEMQENPPLSPQNDDNITSPKKPLTSPKSHSPPKTPKHVLSPSNRDLLKTALDGKQVFSGVEKL